MAPSTLCSSVHNKSCICDYLSQYVHPGIKFLVKTVAQHNNDIREITSTVTSNMSKVENFANACIGNFGQIEVAYQSLQANAEKLNTRLDLLESELNKKFASMSTFAWISVLFLLSLVLSWKMVTVPAPLCWITLSAAPVAPPPVMVASPSFLRVRASVWL